MNKYEDFIIIYKAALEGIMESESKKEARSYLIWLENRCCRNINDIPKNKRTEYYNLMESLYEIMKKFE